MRCRVQGDWLMSGTYPTATLLHSRARRGGDDAHARDGGGNVFRDAASPFRRCAAMMYPFLRADSSFCVILVCVDTLGLHATQCIAHVDSLK